MSAPTRTLARRAAAAVVRRDPPAGVVAPRPDLVPLCLLAFPVIAVVASGLASLLGPRVLVYAAVAFVAFGVAAAWSCGSDRR